MGPPLRVVLLALCLCAASAATDVGEIGYEMPPSQTVCGQYLCVTVDSAAPGVGYFPPRKAPKQRPKYPNIYFPTIPRCGNTHTRKLWEAITHVGSESVYAESSNVDRRSGGHVRKCGGISVTSRGGGGASGGSCRDVHAGKSKEPILLKSHDKTYFKMFYLQRSTHILLMVRNPVDNYVSDFVDRNMAQKNPNFKRATDLRKIGKLKYTAPFEQWVDDWVGWVNLWLGPATRKYPCSKEVHGRGERVTCSRPDLPVYMMRYEDLYRDSSGVMHDFMDRFGVLSGMNISEAQLRESVGKTEDAAKGGRPNNPANSKDAFDYVADSRRRAQKVVHALQRPRLRKLLQRFGYSFSLKEAEGERSPEYAR